MIHTVKGFGIVNKAEIDVFLELSCFFNDPADVDNLIPGSSAFSKTSAFSKAKDREALYSQQKQDQELTLAQFTNSFLNAKFRLKLKNVGKTTRPFRYDLNQIPYDYTVEVRNRLKGLDLRDRVPDELWTEVHDIVQETGIKTIPMEKKCKKAKWLSEEALQIAVKRREVKSKGEKERYSHLNAEVQRIARRDKKAFLSDQCKEIKQ